MHFGFFTVKSTAVFRFMRTLILLPGLLAAGFQLAAAPINLAETGDLFVTANSSRSWLREVSASRPLKLSPGSSVQAEWREPRDVREIVLRCGGEALTPEAVKVEWWHRIWPDNGTGGWMRLDDPFNGEWAVAKTRIQAAGKELRISFEPLTTNEVAGIKHTGASGRQTYKVRLSSTSPVTVEGLEMHSDALLKPASLRFEFGCRNVQRGGKPGFEAVNGRILTTTLPARNVSLVSGEFADTTNRLSADRGYVICRRGATNSFSVFVDDVLREGGIYVRDMDVFVSDAARGWTYASWPGASGEVWKEGTIAERVARMPEQSFEQVMRAIPKKPVPETYLGAPNLRQRFALGARGEMILRADMLRSPGPDLERRPWDYGELVFQFGSGPEPGWWKKDQRQVTRSLEEGWLPAVTHEWKDGEFAYRQRSVAAPLLHDMAALNSRTGTEPVVMVNEVSIRNTSGERRTALLWLALNHPDDLQLQDAELLSLRAPSRGTNRAGLTPVRAVIHAGGKGRLELLAAGAGGSVSNVLRYEVELAPGESHAIELAMPYIELLDDRELAALKQARYGPLHRQVVQFWTERVGRGMTYQVPDQFLNEFFKANLWHLLLTAEIDPLTGHWQHGAATHHYKNYLNETVMAAQSLELRGEHDAAWKLLEPFLASQGAKGLPGNFKSKEGVLYAARPSDPDPYTAQGYNMHHGWCLWGVAEHYEWTKDQAWLRSVADKLVLGCDWIANERRATKLMNPDGSKPLEYGLAPAGDLEDVEEYQYFYATDAYYYLGMKHVVEGLKRIGHPAARRLAKEAEAFKRDIQASVARSVAATPVVRLKDGTWVPYVPSRAYTSTHLKEGWVREGLYPALHLFDGEIYAEDHPFMEWMAQDLEDNIFLSKESGYGVADQRANFFNFGGFTLQPNLLNLPIANLKRDRVANFLRGFYNTCWASLYPETMCFAEWVPYYGKGGGPLFKTPDECKFVQWMRQMLVLERGQSLELGLGVPQAWMRDGQQVSIQRAATFFGPLDLQIRSRANAGEIEATVRLSKTDKPETIALRLRHPEGRPIKSATVNGKPAQFNAGRQLIALPAKDSAWEVRARF